MPRYELTGTEMQELARHTITGLDAACMALHSVQCQTVADSSLPAMLRVELVLRHQRTINRMARMIYNEERQLAKEKHS